MYKTPEQTARDNIDKMLERSDWVVVDKNTINWGLGPGLAVREYQTDAGPADYVLFVDRQPLNLIEAKKETEGHRLSVHESQAELHARSNLSLEPIWSHISGSGGFCHGRWTFFCEEADRVLEPASRCQR